MWLFYLKTCRVGGDGSVESGKAGREKAFHHEGHKDSRRKCFYGFSMGCFVDEDGGIAGMLLKEVTVTCCAGRAFLGYGCKLAGCNWAEILDRTGECFNKSVNFLIGSEAT